MLGFDSEGIHAVEITGSTLYEAAVLALAEFRRCGFADAMFGPATKMTVKVRQPEMSHTVSVSRLKSWLDGSGKRSLRARDEESVEGNGVLSSIGGRYHKLR
jgi:hypothetical protein